MSMEELVELMNMMNYNLSRENGKSILGEIEMKITDLHFKNMSKLSPENQKEQTSYFETNLYTNPAMFSSKIDYSGLDKVANYYQSRKNDYNISNLKQVDIEKSL